MGVRMFLVDAFTDGPFSGNPAGVCLLPDGEVEAAWMQAVAAEMNQAETAFLRPCSDGWELRWFTPTIEVDLCGHATLAAAHVLWGQGLLPTEAPLRFHTRSGVLGAHYSEGRIVLDFPAVAMTPCAPPDGLIDALGVQPLSVFRAGPDYVIEVLDESSVVGAQPDQVVLASIPCRGIGITARSDAQGGDGCDIVSRFFAPAAGIPEDAVTGSLHCALGPFWSRRLRRATLHCRQRSRRGGLLHVTPRDGRVLLAGDAVTSLAGTWHV
jgi:PhzF family phenazine biosynthesis protein